MVDAVIAGALAVAVDALPVGMRLAHRDRLALRPIVAHVANAVAMAKFHDMARAVAAFHERIGIAVVALPAQPLPDLAAMDAGEEQLGFGCRSVSNDPVRPIAQRIAIGQIGVDHAGDFAEPLRWRRGIGNRVGDKRERRKADEGRKYSSEAGHGRFSNGRGIVDSQRPIIPADQPASHAGRCAVVRFRPAPVRPSTDRHREAAAIRHAVRWPAPVGRNHSAVA